MASAGLRVCYLAGRELSYSRTRNVIKALEAAGFELSVLAPAGRSKLHQPQLLWQFLRQSGEFDVVLVGFYGQLLMPFVRAFSQKPIVFDVYAATYGTMVDDRLQAKRGSLLARLFWLADHLAMSKADRIILDSDSQIAHFAARYRVDAHKFRRVFLCSDDSVVYPRETAASSSRLLVHFHGEYAPFHGVDVILRAAKLLEGQPIDFQLIGSGITYERDRALAAELGLTSVRFIDSVPYAELAEHMSRADVCLGIFGKNPRADREFTNKVVEAMAVGKALVTRRNPTVSELLTDGESALLVAPGDPRALADALLRLRLGQSALEVFRRHCSHAAFSAQLGEVLRSVVAEAASPSRVSAPRSPSL